MAPAHGRWSIERLPVRSGPRGIAPSGRCRAVAWRKSPAPIRNLISADGPRDSRSRPAAAAVRYRGSAGARTTDHFARRKRLHVSRNINREFEERLTFGQRLADRVAAFGGSWTFIIAFFLFLLLWVLLNTAFLVEGIGAFDAYPYVFLNLILSMLAAIQAPVIMMSQNRQAVKDRLQAGHDDEVNLKAELEIMALHEKFDEMRNTELTQLVNRQHEVLQLLLDAIRSGNPRTHPEDSPTGPGASAEA